MADKDITVDANVTSKTTPVAADRTFMSDSETTPNTLKDITLENLMKVINALTAETTPVIADSLPFYDASATAARKLTLDNFYKTITGLTEDTAPDTIADFLVSYDASAAAGKKLRLVYLAAQFVPEGYLVNGKLSVTVSANDLIVAIKGLDGNDPSSSNPVAVKINNTVRTITAATSMTLADATNWYNAGSSELATKEIDYFAYAVWDSNSSIVAVSAARIPNGRLVSDFSSTTTNEKYLGNYANFTSTDDCINIGRFAATLSAGAGYTWTVPTFTNVNLIQQPIYETRRLSWAPTLTGYSANPTSTVYQYVLKGNLLKLLIREGANGTSNATSLTMTAPFTAVTVTDASWLGVGAGIDNGAGLTTTLRITIDSATSTITVLPNMSASSVWTNSGGKRIALGNIEYPIG